jgi:hypothetical protein
MIWLKACLCRHKLAFVLVGSIVFMAFVYGGIWTKRPDFFRIQTDVNFLPLDVVQLISADNSPPGAAPDIPARDENAVVKKLLQAANDVKDSTAEENKLRGQLRDMDLRVDEGQKRFDELTEQQIETFKTARTAAPKAALDEIQQKEEDEFFRPNGVNSCAQLPIGDLKVACSLLDVEKGYRALALAQATSEALNTIVNQRVGFTLLPEQQQFLALARERNKLDISVYQAWQQTLTKRLELYHLSNQYREALLNRLTFVDFLYFSVGGATTANFGDISPNHWFIRLLVCFQVLISVVLINLFAAGLAKGAEVRTPGP